MVEQLIITGTDLAIEHHGTTTVIEAEPEQPELLPAPKTTLDLGAVIEAAAIDNPYWSDEANDAADNRPPGVRPVDVAKRYRKHRRTPQS